MFSEIVRLILRQSINNETQFQVKLETHFWGKRGNTFLGELLGQTRSFVSKVHLNVISSEKEEDVKFHFRPLPTKSNETILSKIARTSLFLVPFGNGNEVHKRRTTYGGTSEEKYGNHIFRGCSKLAKREHHPQVRRDQLNTVLYLF